MNKQQLNKLTMYRTTRAVLAAASEPRSVVAFPRVFARFEEKIVAIETLVARQRIPIAVTVAQREAVFTEMIDAVLAAAGIGSTYANQQNLASFALEVELHPSDFVRARIDDRVRLAQRLVDVLRPRLPELAALGLTPPVLEAVQARIDAAAEAAPTARLTIAERNAVTATLADAFRAVDRLLAKEMDVLLRPLQRAHSQFYQIYRGARAVLDPQGGRPAAKADVEAEFVSFPTIVEAVSPPARQVA